MTLFELNERSCLCMEGNKNSYKLYGSKLKKQLPKDEQNKYLELAVQGDYEAKQKLFEHNLRLVGQVVGKRYYKVDCDKEELFQVGSMGLWKAIQNFDMSFGTEFSTYAFPMIIGEIRRYLRDNNSLLRISRSVKDLAYKIIKIKEEYDRKGIEIDTKQLADLLEVSEQEIIDAIQSHAPIDSLSKEVFESKDGNTFDIESTIEDPTMDIESIIEDPIADIEEQLVKKELYMKINETINKLDDTERKIIKYLFGFDCKRKTQEEIAEKLNISQPQVSKIYKRTLNDLAFLLPKSISDEAQKERKAVNRLVDRGEKQMSSRLKYGVQKKETIFDLYPEYSKKQILEVVDSLGETNKKIIELRYGLNGNESTTNKEISKILNILESSVSSNIVLAKKQMSSRLKYGIKKKETIFDLYPEYTEEQILGAISTLSEENKKIIELKYGLNGNKEISNQEIGQLLNWDNQTVAIRIFNIKKQIRNRLEKFLNNEKSLFALFPNCTKEKILEVVNLVNELNRKISEVIDSVNEVNKKTMELKYILNSNKLIGNGDKQN